MTLQILNSGRTETGNEPKDCRTREFTLQKLNYIHQNPVRAGIVYEAEKYVYSSAINYIGEKGLIDVILPE